MQDIMRRFIAQPAVFPLNKASKVKIIALKGKTMFKDGTEYKVFVVPMSYSRKKNKAEPDFVVKAKNGMLCFEYTFFHECEYEIRFTDNDDSPMQKTSVYALENDLYELRPLKCDFHVHTNRSDSDDDPEEVVANYRREGYDSIVITDHNRYFPSKEAQEAFADTKTDINVVNGEEVHTPISHLHIVHVGGKKSVDEYYVKNPEAYQKEVDEIEASMPEGEYRHVLAMAKWATKKIHDADGIAILPHPFWIQALENSIYNINLPLLEELFNSGWFDAYELLGAMQVHGNNLSINYFNDLRAKGFDIPFVASSDSHKTLKDTRMHFGNLYTIVFAKSNTRDGLIEAIKNHMTVAVEHIHNDSEVNPEYRVYSNFRLALYARFLLDNYFARTKEICKAEGIMMREYSLGVDGAKQALEAMSGRTDRFYAHFFGKNESGYYNTASFKSRYDEFNKVWDEYGVVSRGSKVVYKDK